MSKTEIAARLLLLLAAGVGVAFSGIYGWVVLGLILTALVLLWRPGDEA